MKRFFLIFGQAVSFVLLLMVVTGCGAKKKVAVHEEPAIRLTPGQQRVADWHTLMSEKKYAPEMEKLESVNTFFNKLRFVDDIDHWGKEDYWATPQEMLMSNGGDCEDYVVAKYFVLRALGVGDQHLYLTYVKAVSENRAHMVLSYFAQSASTPLILDNYNPRILPADQRRDLLPVYSFNAKSLFLTNASAGLGQSLPTDRIKNNKWQKLLDKVNGSRQ